MSDDNSSAIQSGADAGGYGSSAGMPQISLVPRKDVDTQQKVEPQDQFDLYKMDEAYDSIKDEVTDALELERSEFNARIEMLEASLLAAGKTKEEIASLTANLTDRFNSGRLRMIEPLAMEKEEE